MPSYPSELNKVEERIQCEEEEQNDRTTLQHICIVLCART